MSEYTRYFAVHGSSETDILRILNERRIPAVVDDEFREEDGVLRRWIPVAVPNDAGMRDGVFFSESRWPQFRSLFSKSLFFCLHSNHYDWEVSIATPGTLVDLSFTEDEQTLIDTALVQALSDYFGVAPETLRPHFNERAGSPYLFCKTIGMPFLEMFDQNTCDSRQWVDAHAGRFAILSSQLAD